MSLYELAAKSIDGKDVMMKEYEGKVLLFVNVASRCGFTPQYEGLQKLQEKYADRGFSVLGFPCNQFMSQEPGDEEEIKLFCSSKYNVSFPMFAKVNVNGSDVAPIFQYLKSEAPGFLGTTAVKWNFTKFLVNREGKVVERFSPTTTPESIESSIEKLL